MDKPKQKDKPAEESMTLFERQEEAWYENDCQGSIEEQDGA